MSYSPRVAVVTGANKGIGLAIAKRLATADPLLVVVLTARSEERGRAAVKSLNLPNVRLHQLDVTDTSSVSRLREWLEKEYAGVDILVSNAGWKGDEFNAEVARNTVECNFWGVVNVWEGLADLVRARRGRVVTVSSRSGDVNRIAREDLKSKFVSAVATVQDVKDLMRKFVRDVENGTWKEEGWPKEAYGVSKIGASALTCALARAEAKNGVALYACCPGLVKTDMSYSWAPLSPEEGADTPVYLATTPNDNGELVNGGFYAERTLQPFEKGSILPEYLIKLFKEKLGVVVSSS